MRGILFMILFSPFVLFGAQKEVPLNFAVLGLGGRAQWLLMECIKLRDDLHVVAICDDNAHECVEEQTKRLRATDDPHLLDIYQKALAGVELYCNTPEDLERLFTEHSEIDTILIASANYDHLPQLNGALEHAKGKKIFMEKPIFITLEDFNQFDFPRAKDATVAIGLTLRFSSMARIVSEELQAHQHQLGKLKSINIWERLNFTHAFTAFVMGKWRRYVSKSGGLMIEKVVHDGDLGLFFLMDGLKIEPSKMTLSTMTKHTFFIKSNKDNLLAYIQKNEDFQNRVASLSQWELKNRITYDEKGAIDWSKSLDRIFEEYPEDDDYTTSDLIPDYHRLNAKIETTTGDVIEFQLEVDITGYRPATERAQLLTFENGTVQVDVMGNEMCVRLNDGTVYRYDLQTNGTDHADGDKYIIETIVGQSLAEGHSIATLNDPIVKLATLMILVSENQVKQGIKSSRLQKKGETWEVL